MKCFNFKDNSIFLFHLKRYEVIPQFDQAVFFLQNYSVKKKNQNVAYSDTLNVHGNEWRLKVYLNGNDKAKENYLSVFIEMTKGQTKPSCFEYRIEMVNQVSRNVSEARQTFLMEDYIFKYSRREFIIQFEAGACWGYDEFFKLDQLEESGFLLPESDMLIIKYQVRYISYFEFNQAAQNRIADLQKENEELKNQLKPTHPKKWIEEPDISEVKTREQIKKLMKEEYDEQDEVEQESSLNPKGVDESKTENMEIENLIIAFGDNKELEQNLRVPQTNISNKEKFNEKNQDNLEYYRKESGLKQEEGDDDSQEEDHDEEEEEGEESDENDDVSNDIEQDMIDRDDIQDSDEEDLENRNENSINERELPEKNQRIEDNEEVEQENEEDDIDLYCRTEQIRQSVQRELLWENQVEQKNNILLKNQECGGLINNHDYQSQQFQKCSETATINQTHQLEAPQSQRIFDEATNIFYKGSEVSNILKSEVLQVNEQREMKLNDLKQEIKSEQINENMDKMYLCLDQIGDKVDFIKPNENLMYQSDLSANIKKNLLPEFEMEARRLSFEQKQLQTQQISIKDATLVQQNQEKEILQQSQRIPNFSEYQAFESLKFAQQKEKSQEQQNKKAQDIFTSSTYSINDFSSKGIGMIPSSKSDRLSAYSMNLPKASENFGGFQAQQYKYQPKLTEMNINQNQQQSQQQFQHHQTLNHQQETLDQLQGSPMEIKSSYFQPTSSSQSNQEDSLLMMEKQIEKLELLSKMDDKQKVCIPNKKEQITPPAQTLPTQTSLTDARKQVISSINFPDDLIKKINKIKAQGSAVPAPKIEATPKQIKDNQITVQTANNSAIQQNLALNQINEIRIAAPSNTTLNQPLSFESSKSQKELFSGKSISKPATSVISFDQSSLSKQKLYGQTYKMEAPVESSTKQKNN